jgi:hypothetical protein
MLDHVPTLPSIVAVHELCQSALLQHCGAAGVCVQQTWEPHRPRHGVLWRMQQLANRAYCAVHNVLASNNIVNVVAKKIAVNILVLYALSLMTTVPLWPVDLSWLSPAEQTSLTAARGIGSFGAKGVSDMLHPFMLGLGPYVTSSIMLAVVSMAGLDKFSFLPPRFRISKSEMGTLSGHSKVLCCVKRRDLQTLGTHILFVIHSMQSEHNAPCVAMQHAEAHHTQQFELFCLFLARQRQYVTCNATIQGLLCYFAGQVSDGFGSNPHCMCVRMQTDNHFSIRQHLHRPRNDWHRHSLGRWVRPDAQAG